MILYQVLSNNVPKSICQKKKKKVPKSEKFLRTLDVWILPNSVNKTEFCKLITQKPWAPHV